MTQERVAKVDPTKARTLVERFREMKVSRVHDGGKCDLCSDYIDAADTISALLDERERLLEWATDWRQGKDIADSVLERMLELLGGEA